MTATRPPEALTGLVKAFRAAPEDLLVPALHDHARRLPPLPEGLEVTAMEPVVECQAPVRVIAEVDVAASTVHVHVSCPPEAPTTRGFAAVVVEGLAGATPAEVLAVPVDLHRHLHLDRVVTPQRLDGMEALVRRLQAQVRAAVPDT